MSTQHTPGPWFVVEDPQHAGKHPSHAARFICNRPEFETVIPPTPGEDDGWQVFHGDGGTTICSLRDTVDQAADARLIAAAPELLGALKSALRALEDNLSPGPMDEDAKTAARLAIAKATA